MIAGVNFSWQNVSFLTSNNLGRAGQYKKRPSTRLEDPEHEIIIST